MDIRDPQFSGQTNSGCIINSTMVNLSSLYHAHHLSRLSPCPTEKMVAGELTPFNTAVHIPPWDAGILNFNANVGIDSFTALHRYLPVNEFDSLSDESDFLTDAFSGDQFRMFEFKIRRCARGRSHDWTECPFAHPGEKARRRDPRKFHYSGTACTEFRKGGCAKGESCEFAHGVFECWLHPARYRTQPCKDGQSCRRRICFFAHTAEQLRVLPQHSPRNHGSSELEYGSPSRNSFDMYFSNGSFLSSPTSILTSPAISPPSESPPTSPNSPQLVCGSFNSITELIDSVRNVHLGKTKITTGFGSLSPRGSMLRPGFSSPTRTPTRSGLSNFDIWDSTCEEEPVMERVESGRDLRAKIYAKLSKENSLGRVSGVNSADS